MIQLGKTYAKRLILLTVALVLLLLVGDIILERRYAGLEQGLLLDPADSSLVAKDFSIIDLYKKPLRLQDLRGQVVVLNFWATWCPPCVAELPSLVRLQKKMRGHSVSVITINVGEAASKVENFMRHNGLALTVGLDVDARVAFDYAAEKLPTTYIIGKDGYLLYRAIGDRKWDSASTVELVRELAKRPS